MARFGQRFNVPEKASQNPAPAAVDTQLAKAAVKRISKATKVSTPAKTNKSVDKKLDQEKIQEQVLIKQTDAQQVQDKAKKQNSAQSDIFSSKNDSAGERDVTVSQFASEVADRKRQTQKRQAFAQKLQGGAETAAKQSPKSGKTEEAADQNLSATVSQSQTESLDPDAKAKRKAEKMLTRIAKEGGEKGRAFVEFARREVSKGRLAEIEDLIEGFHANLKGDSLTAAELVESGEEPVSILRHMVSADNTDDLAALNNQIVVRPDTEVGFKKDQAFLRNKDVANAERRLPPSFTKSMKPKKMEAAIEFISAFANKAINPAPWDAVAA